jgi:vitamin B12 transport system substrate-binding protein
LKAVAAALAICLSSFAAHVQASARIVTLTPHATEMVFAAGAGDQIVATVQSSDYPLAARDIDRLGDGLNTSVEQVLAFAPDWVVGWPSPLMSQLESLGVRTWVSEPQSLEAIGTEVLAMSRAFGTEQTALDWHARWHEALGALQSAPNGQLIVVVLASPDGQFVIGRHPLINQALSLCGATNPFAASAAQAPLVSAESLIAINPDVMISGRPMNKSVRLPRSVPLHVIDADTLYRPGPRFLSAVLEICTILKQVQTRLETR